MTTLLKEQLILNYFYHSHVISHQIVLHREDEVLNAQCEMPVIHSLLSRIPDDLPYEQLMQHAGDLYIQFPPESLQMDIMKQLQFKLVYENYGTMVNFIYWFGYSICKCFFNGLMLLLNFF